LRLLSDNFALWVFAMAYYDEYELVEHRHLSDCSMFMVELYYRQFHMHKELELILVLRGNGHVSNEKNFFPVKQGDVLLFNSGQIHELNGGDEGLLLLAVQVSRNFCSRYCPQLRSIRFDGNLLNAYFTKSGVEHLQDAMIKGFSDYMEKSMPAAFGCMARLNSVFETLLRHVPYQILDQTQQVNQTKTQERLRRILLYIQEHYREPIRLSEIARQEDLSESHVSRFFREQLNITLQDYLTRLRVEAAMPLLKNTDLSATCIAYECGFSDPKYMNQGFEKLLGMHPHQWRAETQSSGQTEFRYSEHTMQHILSEAEAKQFLSSIQ